MLNVDIVAPPIQQNHKLVAAHARGHVGLANVGADGLGGVDQNGIAGLMAMGVVDLFELIQIQIAQRQAFAVAFSAE